jgi:alpha-mannosidase
MSAYPKSHHTPDSDSFIADINTNWPQEARLLRLKKEIEDKFEQEKWHRIVEAIKSDGGEKYPIAALQKKFKELSKNAVISAHEAASGTGDNRE